MLVPADPMARPAYPTAPPPEDREVPAGPMALQMALQSDPTVRLPYRPGIRANH